MHTQLLLFEDNPTDRMQREIDILHKKYDKLRKGQYAKLNELEKLYKNQHEDLEIIKSAICKNQTRMF
jgi:hypothetical protein